jgi:hypothetical protein
MGQIEEAQMTIGKRTLFAVASVLALAIPAAAAGPAAWLHIKVDEAGPKSNSVRVNLPLAVVEVVAPLMDQEWAKHTQLEAGDKSLKKGDLKAMLAAVRDVEDAEFVRVEGEGDNVQVAKIKGKLVVRVKEKGSSQDKVTIEVPMEVADALLSAPGDELNFSAALQVLRQKGHGPLVTVDEKNSKVRIWIDERNQSE